MNTSIEIQIFLYDSLIIENFLVFIFSNLRFHRHTAPFVSQKERKRREFKAEMEKSKVTLRKAIHKR